MSGPGLLPEGCSPTPAPSLSAQLPSQAQERPKEGRARGMLGDDKQRCKRGRANLAKSRDLPAQGPALTKLWLCHPSPTPAGGLGHHYKALPSQSLRYFHSRGCSCVSKAALLFLPPHVASTVFCNRRWPQPTQPLEPPEPGQNPLPGTGRGALPAWPAGGAQASGFSSWGAL